MEGRDNVEFVKENVIKFIVRKTENTVTNYRELDEETAYPSPSFNPIFVIGNP